MKQLCLLLTVVLIGAGLATRAQDSTHKEFIGKYKFPAGSVVDEVVVAEESGHLTMNSSAGASVLELLKGDSFNLVTFNGTAVFRRNDAKKITGVHIDASGYVLDGVKDSASFQISISTRPVTPSVVNTGNTPVTNVIVFKDPADKRNAYRFTTVGIK